MGLSDNSPEWGTVDRTNAGAGYNTPGYNDYLAQVRAQEARRREGQGDNTRSGPGAFLFPEMKGEDAAYQPEARGFQYGGVYGGADQAAGRYQQLGAMAGMQPAYQMDASQENQARGYQNAAAGSYLDAMRGRTPSLAEMQMRQGLAQNNASASSMAASARGGGANLASAQRNAMRTMGEANSNTAMNAAMLRANEQDMARRGLAGVGGQMRGQDIGWQQGRGSLEAQQRGLNAQQQMGYERMGQQTQLAQQQANAEYERLKWEAEQAQRQQNYNTQQYNVGQANDRSAGLFSGIGSLFGIPSDENLKKDVSDTNPYGNMNYSGGIFRPSEQESDTAPNYMSGYQAYSKGLRDASPRQSSSESSGTRQGKGLGDMLGGLLKGGGGGLFSDENLKRDVKSAALSMADKLEPKSYRYNWESESEPKRIGVMAQDMEKSPAGASAVHDTPAGKVIDVNRGLSLALASVAALKDEVDSLKGKRRNV